MSVPRAEWPFHEVLSDEHSRPLETVSVYCSKVEPKDTSAVLKQVNIVAQQESRAEADRHTPLYNT